jgi:hypothetical protein
MTGYFAVEAVSPDAYSIGRGRSWLQFRRRGSRRDQALCATFIAPSLVAEIAPLIYFWDAHLPVWQISVMMAVSWVVGWWATCIIALPRLSTSRRLFLILHRHV